MKWFSLAPLKFCPKHASTLKKRYTQQNSLLFGNHDAKQGPHALTALHAVARNAANAAGAASHHSRNG